MVRLVLVIYTRTRKAKNTVRMLYSEDKFAMYDNIKDLSKSALQVKKFKPDVVIDDYLQL